MKKIISILFLVAFVASATFGQTFAPGSGSATQAPIIKGDTITNTGSAYKIIKVSGGYSTLSFQPILYNTSGTGAGIVTDSASNDGIHYVALRDSLGGRNTTKAVTKLFKIDNPEYTYYKIAFTGTGTMVTRWILFASLRKQMTLISTP